MSMGDGVDLEAAVRALASPMVLMERVLDEALRLIEAADGAVVQLVEGDQLTYACTAGALTDHCGMRAPLDGTLSGLAVQTGSTLVCDDAQDDPRVDPAVSQAIGARSMICVPLHYARQEVGILKVTATRPHAFSPRDVATLAGLSTFVSAAIGAAAALHLAADELLSSGDVADGSGAVRDTRGMSAFVANVLHPGVVADIEAAHDVERLLDRRAFHIAYQPVVDVEDGRVVIVEALTRFDTDPYRTPDRWFADAWRAGLGAELELAAVEAALSDLSGLPEGCHLALNLSPPVVTRPLLRHLLAGVDPARVVIELTEHDAIDDYHRVRNTLACLRAFGVRLAVDDTGAGFASLSHIIKLAPDLIKLDYELIHGIAADPVRRSLATAIVAFAADIGSDIVAEGVETDEELEVVRELGIRYAQGYLLGRPGNLGDITSVVPIARPVRRPVAGRLGRRSRPSPFRRATDAAVR
jgi:EAL domain-containing protein (putative c-di-GMP-specific phosphodiesterase class I)/putative methionine-R-sulfoxide reductase with GAF domain